MPVHLHLPRRGNLLTATILCGVLSALASCKNKPTPPAPTAKDERIIVGADVPLTNDRLKGARLDAIQSTTTWNFTDTSFTVENRGGPLPPNVAASILGSGATAKRVTGDWRFDANAGVMVLSNMERDGEKVDGNVTLPIHAAGSLRANFGTEQYGIDTAQDLRAEELRRLERKSPPAPVQR